MTEGPQQAECPVPDIRFTAPDPLHMQRLAYLQLLLDLIERSRPGDEPGLCDRVERTLAVIEAATGSALRHRVPRALPVNQPGARPWRHLARRRFPPLVCREATTQTGHTRHNRLTSCRITTKDH